MPIIRKLIHVGKTSKAVILPKSWLEFYEHKTDRLITNVAIEVNNELKITPVFMKIRKDDPHTTHKHAREVKI